MEKENKQKQVISKIFKDLLFKQKGIILNIDDKELEGVLKGYILSFLGYHTFHEYENYSNNKISSFDCFRQVTRSFENLINNLQPDDLKDICSYIVKYPVLYFEKLANYPYVKILFDSAYKLYSPDCSNVLIAQNKNSYRIDFITKFDDNDMPSLYIDDIDKFEVILRKYIDTVKQSDSLFKNTLYNFDDKNEGIFQLFYWALINISPCEAGDLQYYFSKYSSFLTDTTLDKYKARPIQIGKIFNDELYLYLRKSEASYETPYYLSYMLKNNIVELPNIRLGIQCEGDRKIANILAIQTSQAGKIVSSQNYYKLNKIIKNLSPKAKNFRFHNPFHLASLILTVGLLNGYGISFMSFPEYIPFRYQRFVIEGRKSTDELDSFQQRLTNNYMNTIFRMLEFTNDIEIYNMPENGESLVLHLNDNIEFNNDFFNELYQIGYNEGLKSRDLNNINQKDICKKKSYLY